MSSLLIIAGGTGGHVFPALAIAHALRRQGVAVTWLGTRQGLEASVVPAAGIAIDWLTIRGLRRAGLWAWLLLPFRLTAAMWQSWHVLRRRRPDAVLAMGGFVAGPGGLVAWLRRTPLLIHEQNAVAGLTNRWLALIADVVMSGFPEAFGVLPGVRHVGNPVRAEILSLPAPQERLAGRGGRLRVLVIGGSRGAQVFNKVLPQTVALIKPELRPELWHQAGRGQVASVERAYQAGGGAARVSEFIDDMAQAYAWADVIVCRAGAMTLAEVAAAGLAAILVPYPYAVDDHQTVNARFLTERDAAILLPESEFTPARVAELLAGFASQREVLVKMASHARACAMPDAADAAAQLCVESMSRGPHGGVYA
jgi:UDP-N-acetylglucosamine--N-acetylmuramyl-(pentapeptide) pyrophosphoryl-undecaprenol N-acetylglucosamine transferase